MASGGRDAGAVTPAPFVMGEEPGAIVAGFDVHRRQITIDALDTASGEVSPRAASPTRTPPASCSTSRSPAPNRNGRHAYNWSSALTAFRIHFGDRIPDGAI